MDSTSARATSRWGRRQIGDRERSKGRKPGIQLHRKKGSINSIAKSETGKKGDCVRK